MLVSKLIDLLKTQDPNSEVFISYDSMVVTTDEFVVMRIEQETEYYNPGIYLVVAEEDEIVNYILDDMKSGEYKLLQVNK